MTAVTEQKLGAFIKYVNGLSATSDNDTHYKYELLAYLREAQRALSAQPQEVGAAENSFDKQSPLNLKLWLDTRYNATGDLRYIHAGNALMELIELHSRPSG